MTLDKHFSASRRYYKGVNGKGQSLLIQKLESHDSLFEIHYGVISANGMRGLVYLAHYKHTIGIIVTAIDIER